MRLSHRWYARGQHRQRKIISSALAGSSSWGRSELETFLVLISWHLQQMQQGRNNLGGFATVLAPAKDATREESLEGFATVLAPATDTTREELSPIGTNTKRKAVELQM